MSKRIVMRLTQWSQNIETVQLFLDNARELGAGPRSKLTYAVDAEGCPCFIIDLPDRVVEAIERKRRPKAPTKAQRAVTDQLEARRKAAAAKQPVPGHVPPVVKNGKVIATIKRKKKKA